VDLTQIDGLAPYLALKLVGECGTNLTAWPSAKHFTSWLALAPHNKISGGKVLASKTRRTSNRAASCCASPPARWVEPTPLLVPSTAVCQRGWGKQRQSPPPARKIAVLFYNTLRLGMPYADPGAAYYEDRYRQARKSGQFLVPQTPFR
jgi:transposase